MAGWGDALMMLLAGGGAASQGWENIEQRRAKERAEAERKAQLASEQERTQRLDTAELHSKGFRQEADAVGASTLAIPGMMPAQQTDRFDTNRYDRVGKGLVFDKIDNPDARQERFSAAQAVEQRKARMAEQQAAQQARAEEAQARREEAAQRASQDRSLRLQIAGMARDNRNSGEASQPKPPSEGERRAGALFQVARDAFGVLENSKPPTRVEAGMARLGMNEGLSQQRQLMNQAARQFATSYLYVVSGATASPQEVENLANQIEEKPGDKPETLARKRQARVTMMQALETMGGRAVNAPQPNAPQQAAPVNPWR